MARFTSDEFRKLNWKQQLRAQLEHRAPLAPTETGEERRARLAHDAEEAERTEHGLHIALLIGFVLLLATIVWGTYGAEIALVSGFLLLLAAAAGYGVGRENRR